MQMFEPGSNRFVRVTPTIFTVQRSIGDRFGENMPNPAAFRIYLVNGFIEV